jgi:hypothetical protein
VERQAIWKEAQTWCTSGVDLHRNRSSLVGLDEAGSVVLKRSIPSEPKAFREVFGVLEPGPIEVAFEATYGWGWFADLLTDAGVTAHMVHPLATKAIATPRVKNDTVDARTLADLLRTHFLAEAWMAPLEVREARRLVRSLSPSSGSAPGSRARSTLSLPTMVFDSS